MTPAFSGLVRGRLPIEISTRGAKFAEEADQSEEQAEGEVRDLELSLKAVADGLSEAKIEIGRLKKEVTVRDCQ